MWQLDADHPDRKGEQLRKIAPVLKIFAERAKEKGGKVGVFIDYCSLPQRSRASHRAGAAAAEAARAAARAAAKAAARAAAVAAAAVGLAVVAMARAAGMRVPAMAAAATGR